MFTVVSQKVTTQDGKPTKADNQHTFPTEYKQYFLQETSNLFTVPVTSDNPGQEL